MNNIVRLLLVNLVSNKRSVRGLLGQWREMRDYWNGESPAYWPFAKTIAADVDFLERHRTRDE